jgi:hypothetical protein
VEAGTVGGDAYLVTEVPIRLGVAHPTEIQGTKTCEPRAHFDGGAEGHRRLVPYLIFQIWSLGW